MGVVRHSDDAKMTENMSRREETIYYSRHGLYDLLNYVRMRRSEGRIACDSASASNVFNAVEGPISKSDLW